MPQSKPRPNSVGQSARLFAESDLALAQVFKMLEARPSDEWSRLWDLHTPEYWRCYWLRAARLSEIHAACRWSELSERSREQIKAAQRAALLYLVGEG